MSNCCRCFVNNNNNMSCNNSNNTANQNATATNNDNNNDTANNNNNCTNQNLLSSLCNCIGRRCTCEFEIENGLESKTGILERVGDDFLLLRSLNNNRVMYCRTCNLRFVTIMC